MALLENNLRIALKHRFLDCRIQLSGQQSKCLLMLLEGKTAKQIAGILQLSQRTVEHYLEKVREILGCSSNKELIVLSITHLIKNNNELKY